MTGDDGGDAVDASDAVDRPPDPTDGADAERRRPPSRRRSALAWGGVGGLSFLVAHQGYVLLGNAGVSLPAALGVATVVFAVASVLSYLAEGALARRNESA